MMLTNHRYTYTVYISISRVLDEDDPDKEKTGLTIEKMMNILQKFYVTIKKRLSQICRIEDKLEDHSLVKKLRHLEKNKK